MEKFVNFSSHQTLKCLGMEEWKNAAMITKTETVLNKLKKLSVFIEGRACIYLGVCSKRQVH